MKNLRLLAGLVSMALLSDGACAYGQKIITLEEIFESAEANSIQLRPSITASKEAQHEISVAKSQRLPNIDLSLSLSYIGNGFTTNRNYSDFQKAPIPHLGTGLSLNVNQPVYTGGAITNAINMAELKLTASRYSEELNRDNIRMSLTGYYLDIYKYYNLQKVVASNLDAARIVLKEMQARFQQGTALKNDITRYELLISNLELQQTRFANTIKILNSNLVTLAGLPEGTIITPDEKILEKSLPIYGEEWWQDEARVNAPRIMLAKAGVDINLVAESLDKADRLPKIGLIASWTMDGPILVEVPPINRNLSYWFFGVGVNYSLSSLYKTNHKLAKSKAATQKARDELAATRENIELEVRADNVKYLEAYEELKTMQKSVELAEQNYQTTSTRYSADMALITDMLDAANAKLDAQQQLVNSQINIIYYYYKLLFTSGKI